LKDLRPLHAARGGGCPHPPACRSRGYPSAASVARGSCSVRGTISLNACLLFQRPEVVDYLNRA